MDENPTIDFLENCWYTCCNETTFLKKGYSARIIVPRAGSLTTFSSDFSVSSHCNLKLAVLSGVKEESKSNQHRKELAWRDEHRLLPYDESVALLACSLLSWYLPAMLTVRYRLPVRYGIVWYTMKFYTLVILCWPNISGSFTSM